MKHTQLKYEYIKSVDSWENPIAKNGYYDDCQIAEFTGCYDDDDNYYEILYYNNQTFCIDSKGNEVDVPETDNFQDDSNIYLYYDDETDSYFEQNTNGNFWYQIEKPILVNPF